MTPLIVRSTTDESAMIFVTIRDEIITAFNYKSFKSINMPSVAIAL